MSWRIWQGFINLAAALQIRRFSMSSRASLGGVRHPRRIGPAGRGICRVRSTATRLRPDPGSPQGSRLPPPSPPQPSHRPPDEAGGPDPRRAARRRAGHRSDDRHAAAGGRSGEGHHAQVRRHRADPDGEAHPDGAGARSGGAAHLDAEAESVRRRAQAAQFGGGGQDRPAFRGAGGGARRRRGGDPGR